ncbi:alpha/beta hydrolase-fold protein [Jonesiaceae bacterium BS-20]|uniref:Alpha/beta hydrolase-fold protein n=1 Tax=Jonesiaceae bacterium BS-20 TaxID=3120821 RepID=A0AAU7DXH4_9MICO
MKLVSRLLGAACAATLVLAVGACSSDAEPPQVRAVTTLAQVLPQGLTVTALAIEYDRELPKGQVPADAFEVATTLCLEGQSRHGTGDGGAKCTFDDAPRTVVSGHTSSTKTLSGQASAGAFVILELSPQDQAAAAALYDGTYSDYFALDEALTVTQVNDWNLGKTKFPKTPATSVTSSASYRHVVDEYASHEFASQSGVVMPYRLRTPDNPQDQRAPLVVTLHGHGESGSDNLSQIAGTQISVAFADLDRQASNPAFILSPQTAQGVPGGAEGTGWWDPNWRAAVLELVQQTIADNPQIDPDRVYLTGLSMGAYGSWQLLAEHSDLFAGAVLVCGEGEVTEALAELTDFPIWVTHSEDDFVVPYDAPGAGQQIFEAFEAAGVPVTWSQWAGDLPLQEQRALAQATWDEAKQTGSNHILTKFPANTTPVLPHFSWIPTFENDMILDWLFSQRR